MGPAMPELITGMTLLMVASRVLFWVAAGGGAPTEVVSGVAEADSALYWNRNNGNQ